MKRYLKFGSIREEKSFKKAKQSDDQRNERASIPEPIGKHSDGSSNLETTMTCPLAISDTKSERDDHSSCDRHRDSLLPSRAVDSYSSQSILIQNPSSSVKFVPPSEKKLSSYSKTKGATSLRLNGSKTGTEENKISEKKDKVSTVRVAIIGTAGRKEDAHKMSHLLFCSMVEQAEHTIVSDWGLDPQSVTLVSGGAAGADHVAVRLFLKGGYQGIQLHLPCLFQQTKLQPQPQSQGQLTKPISKNVCVQPISGLRGQFYDNGSKDWRTNPGAYTNRLHHAFSKQIKSSSLNEIERVLGYAQRQNITAETLDKSERDRSTSSVRDEERAWSSSALTHDKLQRKNPLESSCSISSCSHDVTSSSESATFTFQHKAHSDKKVVGFHARNRQIAESEYLIAFTWAAPGSTGPKQGGTKYTWDLCRGTKLHFSLNGLTKRIIP